MGQNSTEVAYGFGQFGSAFADATANTITAPEELAIVAIQFTAACKLSALVAKDANLFPNIGAAAHDRGNQIIQVNGAVTTGATIIFDTATATLGLKLGDEVYITATGVLAGTITVLNPSTIYNITISATTSVGNDEYVSIVTPNTIASEGTGGMAIDSSNQFPSGLTIVGRWDSVSLGTIGGSVGEGGLIAYFGK